MTELQSLSNEDLLRLVGKPSAAMPQGSLEQMSDIELQALASGRRPKQPLPVLAQTPSETWADVGKSAGVGLAKGGTGLMGAVGTIGSLIDEGKYAAMGLIGRDLERGGIVPKGNTEKFIADLRAAEPPEVRSGRVNYVLGVPMPTGKGFDDVVQSKAGPYYEPKTKLGQYAQTTAEFVPGAVAMPLGAGQSMVGSAMKFGVLPGVASETAGQATAGTKMEPWARLAAGILASGGAALASRPNTAERMVASAAGEVSPQQYWAAEDLMREAQARGITLTPAEAIQQVTGGATRLGDVQRVVESSADAGARLNAAFANRPAQMNAATESALNTIAPRPVAPSALGPQMQEAGQGAVDRLRESINRLSDPYYKAAENVRIPPNDFAQMSALPGFSEALKTIRTTPQLNRYVQNLPDDSVGVLNEIKKQLATSGENAASAASPTRNMQIASGYEQDARAVGQMGRDLSQDYARALEIQAQGRGQVLDPLVAGPVGRIAGSADHVTQGRALMGDRPSPEEVARAVGNLARQNEPATRGLVREHLGRISDGTVAGLDTAGRPNQFGGAAFAREMNAGREGQNIAAALSKLDPNAAENVSALVDVLSATGWRQRPGSLTAFNKEFLDEMKEGGVRGAVKATAKPLQAVSDTMSRARLGSQVNTLADLLLAGPEGLNAVRRMAENGTGNARALAQAILASNSAQQSSGRVNPVANEGR